MINYLIELALIHLLLFGGYWLILKNENQYGILRFFLLFSTFAAVVIPLFRLPDLWAVQNPEVLRKTASLPAIMLNPVEIDHSSSSVFDLLSALKTIYLFVSGWFLFLFIKSIYQVNRLRRIAKTRLINGMKVYVSTEVKGSFNFLNWIFLNEGLSKESDEQLPIINHENAHRKLGHTYDLLFLQLFKIAFWWLPTSWFTLKEIKKIHEYQADINVIFGFDSSQYIKILINNTLKSNGINLASSFHEGFTMKRIKAMKKQISNINSWKLSLITVISAVVLVGFACNEELDTSIQQINKKSSAIAFEQLPIDLQKSIVKPKDQFSYIKVQVTSEEMEAIKSRSLNLKTLEAFEGVDQKQIHMIDIDPDRKVMYIVLNKELPQLDQLTTKSKSTNEIFTMVENQPEFPDGMRAYYKYVTDNLKYPKSAIDAKLEGRVYVQFIVDTDGSVFDATVVKGISPDCDEEARRVVAESPKFIPGKQRGTPVKVRMVMPIIFNLNSNKEPSSQG